MTPPLRRLAVIGNALPRRCGIATFTSNLVAALRAAHPELQVVLLAMDERPGVIRYGPEVTYTVAQHEPEAYERAADFLNAQRVEAVLLQHEYGIFGGPAGSLLLRLLARLDAPLVTTVHTVLASPDDRQREVMRQLALRSARLVVMGRRGIDFLTDVYGVPGERLAFVPHGVPAAEGWPAAWARTTLGLPPGPLLLTMGLLSRNKGIETVVRALPRIVAAQPELRYLVAGATHPHVKRHEGERYRTELAELAERLGVGERLLFRDVFASEDEVLTLLAAADVVVTPYLQREQITSGVLAYAVGLGKPVLSTPYWHAEELLAGGVGRLFPFDDAEALAERTIALLAEPECLAALAARSAVAGRAMRWPTVANSYRTLLDRVAADARLARRRASRRNPLPENRQLLDHLERLGDDVGLLQHATLTLPNRSEGYTTDDNARALQLVVAARRLGGVDPDRLDRLGERYLAFLRHALNEETGRFRNFLGYERRWLESIGSEQAHGRALRALAALLGAPQTPPAQRLLAQELFDRALPPAAGFTSPRAWAATLLALCERQPRVPGDPVARALAEDLAGRLLRGYRREATAGWRWFEDHLCHANALLPHALIAYADAFGVGVSEGGAETAPEAATEDATEAIAADVTADATAAAEVGLAALAWLREVQTAADGAFEPVGSARVYRRGGSRPRFDQQPLEAFVSVAAYEAAGRFTGDPGWRQSAERAFRWFLGDNPLGENLYDPVTGGCRDGLHPQRMNLNQGAESTLALWLAWLELRLPAGNGGAMGGDEPRKAQGGELATRSLAPRA